MVYRLFLRAVLVALMICCSLHQIYAETVLLQFTSSTCEPCKQMRPVVERLANSGVRVHIIDIMREPQVAEKFHVSRVPTSVVLVNQQEADRVLGVMSFEQLQQKIVRCSAPAPPRTPVMPLGQSTGGSASNITRIEGQIPPRSQADPTAPRAGRIVEIQEPAGFASGSTASVNPFPGQTAGPPPSQRGSLPAQMPMLAQKPMVEATVKITVKDSEGTSAGTGTIVDARSGEALVLTCGHIFRTSQGQGAITVTLYQMGPTGAVQSASFDARIIDFDLNRDLGLVSFRPNFEVHPVRIAPTGTLLPPGTTVTTLGCNRGDNPTVIESRVTSNNRYVGPPNTEVAGAPVEGRSGGGLFNTQGQLVGVCFAADHEEDEGLYAGLESVHAKLDSLGLSVVYSPTATNSTNESTGGKAPAVNLASDFSVRGQQPQASATSTSTAASAPIPQANLEPDEQAALEEIRRRGADAEVICIIRSRDPSGKSEVITLPNASPEFVRALTQNPAATRSTSQHTTAAAAEQLLR